MNTPEKVRIDLWLWSVRLYKTRSKATQACKAGKVSIDGVTAKPATPVRVGQEVRIKRGGFTFCYRVCKLLHKRVGYAMARECYRDITPAEEREKFERWFDVRSFPIEVREKGRGRPTKKERRQLDWFKHSFFDDED